MVCLVQQLWQCFREGGLGVLEQVECVELLLVLGEFVEELCEEFLVYVCGWLEKELRNLEVELGFLFLVFDVLEFIDYGGSGFVGGFCQVVVVYQELFVVQGLVGVEKLVVFVWQLGSCYFVLVEWWLVQEQGGGDNLLLVWVLDCFYWCLWVFGVLLVVVGFVDVVMEIVE